MIGNKCLLDTSIIIHTFNANTNIAARLDNLEEVFVPSIVIGELYFGAHKSSNPTKHISQIENFIANSNIQIVPIDAATAIIYGKIKANLSIKGKPIPENDIWIAAVALQHSLPLFSTDNHFKEIESLILI